MTKVEFAIFGDDPVSLCVAAFKASQGRTVAVIRLPDIMRGSDSAVIPPISNEVWRQLNLHEDHLEIRPVPSRISVGEDGYNVESLPQSEDMQRALRNDDHPDAAIWADFEQIAAARRSQTGSGSGNVGLTLALIGARTESCSEFLDDVLIAEPLKNHLAVFSLTEVGRSAEDIGTSAFVPGVVGDQAWPIRLNNKFSWRDFFNEKAEKNGVKFVNEPVDAIATKNGGGASIELQNAENLAAQCLVFCTRRAANYFGADRCAPSRSLRTQDTATAELVIRFRSSFKPEGIDPRSLVQRALTRTDLERARATAISGGIPDTIPFGVEFLNDKTMIIRSTYLPRKFIDDDEQRDWTGQDKQVLEGQVKAAIVKMFPGIDEKIDTFETRLIPTHGKDVIQDCSNVIAQLCDDDAISRTLALLEGVGRRGS